MAAEYIEREAAKAVLNERYKIRTHMHDLNSAAQLKSAELEIGDIPAADVRPVKRGKWKHDEDGLVWCLNCWFGKERSDERAYNFCPNCGADMRENANG